MIGMCCCWHLKHLNVTLSWPEIEIYYLRYIKQRTGKWSCTALLSSVPWRHVGTVPGTLALDEGYIFVTYPSEVPPYLWIGSWISSSLWTWRQCVPVQSFHLHLLHFKVSVIKSLHMLIFSFQKLTSVWFTVWYLFCYSFVSHSFHTVHLVFTYFTCAASVLSHRLYLWLFLHIADNEGGTEGLY
jgi:hypothetical protein